MSDIVNDPQSAQATQRVDGAPGGSAVSRRTVLRSAGVVGVGGVGAAALAACGATASTTSEAAPAGSSGGTPSATGTSGSAASAGVSVKIADVPVGGGKAFPDASPPYVVTQPTAGQFKAFDGTCTHQGCPVTSVRNGHIVCPCHSSMFDISTGAPTAASPARRPLTAKTVTVDGDSVLVS